MKENPQANCGRPAELNEGAPQPNRTWGRFPYRSVHEIKKSVSRDERKILFFLKAGFHLSPVSSRANQQAHTGQSIRTSGPSLGQGEAGGAVSIKLLLQMLQKANESSYCSFRSLLLHRSLFSSPTEITRARVFIAPNPNQEELVGTLPHSMLNYCQYCKTIPPRAISFAAPRGVLCELPCTAGAGEVPPPGPTGVITTFGRL